MCPNFFYSTPPHPVFSIFLIWRWAELVWSIVISQKIRVFAFCFVLVFIYNLFVLSEGAGWRPEERPSLFLQSGSLWHKCFFTWASLLWVEISSNRELNVKVVLWGGKISLRQVEKSHKVLRISNLPQGLREQETWPLQLQELRRGLCNNSGCGCNKIKYTAFVSVGGSTALASLPPTLHSSEPHTLPLYPLPVASSSRFIIFFSKFAAYLPVSSLTSTALE